MSLFDRIANAFKAMQDPSRKKKKVPHRDASEPAAEKKTVAPVTETPVTAAPATPVAPVAEQPTAEQPTAEPNLTEQTGEYIAVRRDQSFSARMALSEDELRGYYNQIKGAFMDYGVRATVSWRGELFRHGYTKLGEIRVRGKSLYVYFALDPAGVPAKYRGEDVGKTKAFEDMPFCYVVNGERKCAWCCELAALVCEKNGAVKKEVPAADYAAAYPHDTEEGLVNKMLIKEIVTRSSKEKNGWSTGRRAEDTPGVEIYRTDVLYREYASVTVDALEKAFADGDEVTLAALKEKDLVPATADAWRLLPGGKLTRVLRIVTNYCPLQAAEAVRSAGGHVVVWKSTANYNK